MKLVLSTAVSVALLGCIWIAQPRSITVPAFASEVRSAIQHANTWHFEGWRIVGGQKVKWEIWGRRQPFFYREQVGNDVMIDNGRARLRLLPPDSFQKKGYAVSLPSQRLLSAKEVGGDDPQEQFIEGIDGDYLDHLTERSRNSNQIVLAADIDAGLDHDEPSLTVDAHSHLPVHYRLDRATIPTLPSGDFGDRHGPRRVAGELDMKYDVAIPADAATVSIPAAYQNVAAADGLVLRPRIVERDARGRLHVKITHWLCGKPLVLGKAFPWFNAEVLLECPPYTQPGEAQYPTDEYGRRYKPDLGNPNHLDHTDFWFTPIDSITTHSAAMPRMLRIPVVAKLSFDKGVPDRYATVVWDRIPILSTKSILSVPF